MHDSVGKIVRMALGVCIICSILVSTAAVSLNALQAKNKRLDRIKNILQAGGLYEEDGDIEKIYTESVEPTIINLETGEPLAPEQYNEDLDPKTFDIKAMAENSEYTQPLSQQQDIAQIKRLPTYMVVYLVKKEGKLDEIIVPVYGKGLWSTLYGFLALDSDLATIRGLTFYEHGETPGLGGEVDNMRWKSLWNGKQAFDQKGKVTITVIKGQVDPSRPEANHLIDGLSGATITTRGVDQLIKFWLGQDGYGPYLNKLRAGGQYAQG